MENIIKLVNDIFSMSFDIVIPISGNIIAILVALLLFSVRYFSFRHKQRKFAGQKRHDKMLPRTVPLRKSASEFQPLEAAEYCDENICLLLEQAIESRKSFAEQRNSDQVDLLFCSSMNIELHSKALRGEAVETSA